jgi:hypothetical protein
MFDAGRAPGPQVATRSLVSRGLPPLEVQVLCALGPDNDSI